MWDLPWSPGALGRHCLWPWSPAQHCLSLLMLILTIPNPCGCQMPCCFCLTGWSGGAARAASEAGRARPPPAEHPGPSGEWGELWQRGWGRVSAALCTEALSTQPLRLSPSFPGSGFGKSLWKMHSSLPRAARAEVTCLASIWPHKDLLAGSMSPSQLPEQGHPSLGVLVASTRHLC